MFRRRIHPVIYVSAVALVDADYRVLLAQRPPGRSMAGLWEFPGGKIEPGETPEDALVRELKEEIDIGVDIKDLMPLTFASHTYRDFHLLMPLYLCRKWHGPVLPMEEQSLAWAAMGDLSQYEMPPADIPLIKILQEKVDKLRKPLVPKA